MIRKLNLKQAFIAMFNRAIPVIGRQNQGGAYGRLLQPKVVSANLNYSVIAAKNVSPRQGLPGSLNIPGF